MSQNPKNKTIRRGTREVIYNVFIRCLAEFQAGRLLSELDHVYQRTADMTGKSCNTIRQIALEGERNDGVFTTPGKFRKGRPKKEDDNFDICAIRHKVLYFYTIQKQMPTLRNLLPLVRKELGYTGSREHLRKALLSLGFSYKKRQNDSSHSTHMLIEKPRVAASREVYLKEILANRNLPEELRRDIIYVDECYAHPSFKLVKCWQAVGTAGVRQNVPKGKRHTCIIAGSEKGFVPNSTLVFTDNRKNKDFTSEMSHHNFIKWAAKYLIPNLLEPSIIVIDNAPYHSVVTNKAPTSATKTQDIKLWLLENNINFDPNLTKPELLMLVKQHKPEPTYEIDQIFGHHGHTVLRLPPFHCDLNPVEFIWKIAKYKLSALDEDPTETPEAIELALSTITKKDWRNSCNHIINIERDYHEKSRTLYDQKSKSKSKTFYSK